jgi:hypothetical protein
MRMPKLLVLTAALILACVMSAAQNRARAKAKPSPAEEGQFTLRMDLLQLPEKEMAAPRRNIFAPQRGGGARPADLSSFESQQPVRGMTDEESPVLPGEPVPAPPVVTVNLRYIGYIESSRKMIALVVFEGQAVAVVEGEVVGEGVRIGKITREEVGLILPDSSTRAFPLEGEE